MDSSSQQPKVTQIPTDGVLLRCDGLTLSFGGVKALDNVVFEVRAGEIRGLIGPNGAGKTCIINCITGYYQTERGHMFFNGTELNGLPTHRISRLGIARTFQNLGVYPGLTVLENIMAGRHLFLKYGFIAGGIYIGKAHRKEIEHRRRAEEIIDFLELQFTRKAVLGALPYGLRKRVELGRVLAMEPKLLLLDEPMAGMNVEEKEDMARFIIDVNETSNIPIVIIEHDMGVVMDISDRITVLDFGKKIAEGTPHEMKVNPEVIRAYLGAHV